MKRSEFLSKTGGGIAAAVLIPMTARFTKKNQFAETMKNKVIRNGDGKNLNVLGDKMTVKLTGKDTNGQFVLIEENNEPGVGIPPHVHENEDEIFRVIEGKLEVQVAGETAVLGPGDTAFCPRGIPHSWKVVGDKPAKVDLSVFPAGLEEMFQELASLPAGPPDMEKVAAICGKYNVSFVG